MNRRPCRNLMVVLSIAALTSSAQTEPKVFVPFSQQKPAEVTADTPALNTLIPQAASGDSGHVTIHESERIQALMKDYASTKQPLKGFRVQIFLGDRTKAEETRRAFLMKHPETPAYLDYLAPNFRVRAGDQRTKIEGEKLKQELLNEYPGLYVVPCEIEMPRLPEE